MMRITMIVALSAVLIGLAGPGNTAETGRNELIPVTPSYREASFAPTEEPQVSDPYGTAMPAPRDQLYVFWILGRIISYPIDRAESFISDRLKKRSAAPAAQPQPQTASSGPNPFNSVNWSEIPPAPPVSSK